MDSLAFRTAYESMAIEHDMTSLVSRNPVTFKSIIPKKLAINNIFGEVRDACIKASKDMKKDLEKVTQTWKGEKPVMEAEAKIGTLIGPFPGFPKDFTASARPKKNDEMGYKKFLWLDEGTKASYAIMTPNFKPKTKKGQLKSWVGKGGPIMSKSGRVVLRKKPGRGIPARKFTLALRKKWEKPFNTRLEAAMKRAAKASGHSLK